MEIIYTITIKWTDLDVISGVYYFTEIEIPKEMYEEIVDAAKDAYLEEEELVMEDLPCSDEIKELVIEFAVANGDIEESDADDICVELYNRDPEDLLDELDEELPDAEDESQQEDEDADEDGIVHRDDYCEFDDEDYSLHLCRNCEYYSDGTCMRVEKYVGEYDTCDEFIDACY